MVAFVRPTLALPIAFLGILVDWARVGAGLHHVADVAGSTLFVALGAAIALMVAPAVIRVLLPYLPEWAGGSSLAIGRAT